MSFFKHNLELVPLPAAIVGVLFIVGVYHCSSPSAVSETISQEVRRANVTRTPTIIRDVYLQVLDEKLDRIEHRLEVIQCRQAKIMATGWSQYTPKEDEELEVWVKARAKFSQLMSSYSDSPTTLEQDEASVWAEVLEAKRDWNECLGTLPETSPAVREIYRPGENDGKP